MGAKHLAIALLVALAGCRGVRPALDPLASMPRGVLAQTEQRPNELSWHDGGPHPEVLLVLDGIVLGRASEPAVRQRMRELDPSSIHSVEIVAPADAVRQFGPNAERGALLIRRRPRA